MAPAWHISGCSQLRQELQSQGAATSARERKEIPGHYQQQGPQSPGCWNIVYIYIYYKLYHTHTHTYIYIYIYAWYMIHDSMMLYFHVFSHTFYSNLHLPTLCSYAHLVPQSHDSLSHSPQTRGETDQLLAIAKLRSSDCSKRGLHCRINRSSTRWTSRNPAAARVTVSRWKQSSRIHSRY